MRGEESRRIFTSIGRYNHPETTGVTQIRRWGEAREVINKFAIKMRQICRGRPKLLQNEWRLSPGFRFDSTGQKSLELGLFFLARDRGHIDL